jgi:Flp pilus assembly protein TadB
MVACHDIATSFGNAARLLPNIVGQCYRNFRYGIGCRLVLVWLVVGKRYHSGRKSMMMLLFFAASMLMAFSVAIGVMYVNRKLQGVNTGSSEILTYPLETFKSISLLRSLVRHRAASRRRIIPGGWIEHIQHEWKKFGKPERQAANFVAVLEAVFLLSFGFIFFFMTLTFGIIAAIISASLYSGIVVGFTYYKFERDVKKRLQIIDRELPYALDLLSMMLAGGGNIFNSVEVLCRTNAKSPLTQEFRVITTSLYSGKSFLDALRDFADRVELETVNSIVVAMEQGQRLGTPLHQLLKSHATTIRNKRILAAEEHAHTAGTKVFIPASLVMLAIMILLLAPSIIKMFRSMG